MARRVIVIGGGAAGMTAAVFAARQGSSVTLLEGGSSLGKKLLSTGNGRCNFTNRHMESSCYRSGSPEAVSAVLEQFGCEDAVAFFREAGIHVSDRNGYLYPRSEQAAALREALVLAVQSAGAEVLTGQKVAELTAKADGFHLCTDAGKKLQSSAVILAAGGCAAPKTGSDGSGLVLAERLGHTVIAPVPALVPLTLSAPDLCRAWKGTRTKGSICVLSGEKEMASDTGELQLTDYGISGIPTFQVSRFAGVLLQEGHPASVRICFLPEFSADDLRNLSAEFSVSARRIRDFLCGLIPGRLADALTQYAGIRAGIPCYALKGNQKKQLFAAMTALEIPVTGTLDFEFAQATAGGVDLREVDPLRMESRKLPGLFFAGEILDADGICGGYNLQWAWSTGALAGMAAGRNPNKSRKKE